MAIAHVFGYVVYDPASDDRFFSRKRWKRIRGQGRLSAVSSITASWHPSLSAINIQDPGMHNP
jgi:hypothetical protein